MTFTSKSSWRLQISRSNRPCVSSEYLMNAILALAAAVADEGSDIYAIIQASVGTKLSPEFIPGSILFPAEHKPIIRLFWLANHLDLARIMDVDDRIALVPLDLPANLDLLAGPKQLIWREGEVLPI